VAVGQLAPLDDIVHEVMVVGVGRERQRRQHGSEVEHGGELDTELAR
jgi:hypothetical protein